MITSSIYRRTHKTPHAAALYTATRVWTLGELADRTGRMASILTSDSGRGGRVAIVMTSEGEAVAALLATDVAGCSAVLLPVHLEPTELLRYAQMSGAQSILLPPGVQARRGTFKSIEGVEEREGLLWVPLPDQPSTPEVPGAWLLKLTSGSLGPSRLAVRTREGLETEIRAVTQRLMLTSEDRVLCASSLAHSYGLIGGLLASLSAGATVVLPGAPDRLVGMMAATQPTMMFGLSSSYSHLLETDNAKTALRSLRLAFSAGAPLPDGLFDRFLNRFGIHIRQDYGTTETGTISIDMSKSPVPYDVGIPLPHLEVRLAPSDRASADEILVRSPAIAHGYLERDGIVSCLDAEGWYHTGDTGRVDASGRLVLTGRIRPRLQIGGTAIAPEEIEQRIRALQGVHEVVVLGVPDDMGMQQLKAVIVAPALDSTAVRRWCREQLPADQQPAIVELRDALPRSPAGKVLHRDLV